MAMTNKAPGRVELQIQVRNAPRLSTEAAARVRARILEAIATELPDVEGQQQDADPLDVVIVRTPGEFGV